MLGKGQQFSKHDSKVHPVGEAFIVDNTKREEDLYGLPSSLHRSPMHFGDEMNLVVIPAVQVFDSFKSLPYPNPNVELENPFSTLVGLMSAAYYVWDMQVMCLDSHGHVPFCSHSSIEISGVASQRMNPFLRLKKANPC